MEITKHLDEITKIMREKQIPFKKALAVYKARQEVTSTESLKIPKTKGAQP